MADVFSDRLLVERQDFAKGFPLNSNLFWHFTIEPSCCLAGHNPATLINTLCYKTQKNDKNMPVRAPLPSNASLSRPKPTVRGECYKMKHAFSMNIVFYGLTSNTVAAGVPSF
ncbi:hypothetical protein E6O75_ATG05876 [Venturia nashicola]|uniref:Uncharacterized protein n=1 Tax=Venturia nashicola TaxID=86259 RepID=A0A4Z1P3J2_9PEZI|nr:hypothetical protein E6O75_ATG05876 [Venturia nashicola]